jgi:hypothetical protein
MLSEYSRSKYLLVSSHTRKIDDSVGEPPISSHILNIDNSAGEYSQVSSHTRKIDDSVGEPPPVHLTDES